MVLNLQPRTPAARASRWRQVRWLTLAACAAVLPTADSGRLFAQGTQKSAKVVDQRQLTTADQFPLHITYFQSPRGKEAPAVILLHGNGGNRLVWQKSSPPFPQGLAGRLQDEGYAVVTVDLRQHGESKPGNQAETPAAKGRKNGGANISRNDYANMVRFDLEAVKDFLLAEHHKGNLNIRKTAIVAAGMSAPIAIQFATIDWAKRPWDDAPTAANRTPKGQDIRALALISPEENVPGVSAGRAILELSNPSLEVAFLVVYGTKDKLDRGDSKSLFQKVSAHQANEGRVYLQPLEYNLRGTDMIGEGIKVEETILGFLKKHLMSLPDEWRVRKSPLE
jgi:pimeloyl-ACP methyl ester carboxylesterase